MEPTIHHGEKVLVIKQWLLPITPRTVVVVRDPRDGKLLLKRVQQVKNKQVFVVGDNAQESTDSRDFGWIARDDIIGKVLAK